MRARVPDSQTERLAALQDLDVLDTPREADFDDIVELASRICKAPISVVNLIDEHRQWFKAEVGLGVRETPLETSICAHVILEPGLTIINDTLSDPRLADNPLCLAEPGLRFYAGALLKTPEGYPIGTLCVLDNQPRDLDETQRFALEVLAHQVMTQLQLRKVAADERRARELADQRARALEEASRAQDMLILEVDHRVKNSLSMVAAFLNIQSQSAQDRETIGALSVARDRVLAIANLHEQLHVSAKHDKVDMESFVGRLGGSLMQTVPPNVEVRFKAAPLMLDTKSASSIGIIINELVTNAVRHAFPGGRQGVVDVALSGVNGDLHLSVSDTGVGYGNGADRTTRGTGLGMRIIEASVGQLGGEFEHSGIGPGSRFSIRLPLGVDGTAGKSSLA